MIAANEKIERLMYAITEHEGWHSPADTETEGGSRSYRNHNPGNLRASPYAAKIVDGYAVFRNDFVGFMALHWDLMQKAKGNTVTGLNGASTIEDLIYVWAPPSDGNESEAYLEDVIKRTGFTKDTTLAEIFEM